MSGVDNEDQIVYKLVFMCSIVAQLAPPDPAEVALSHPNNGTAKMHGHHLLCIRCAVIPAVTGVPQDRVS